MPFFKLNDHFAGRYQLVELLSEAGSSEVWKAKDKLDDDAVVVLKIFASEKEMGNEGILRLRQEFSRSRNLFHPHLLKANHFDVWESTPYLIMPYYSMGTLADFLQKKGVFSERQVALLLSQIGSALDALHRHETPIIHRAVKPENIVVSQPDIFMLADFGFSSPASGSRQAPGADPGTGTAAYAPPESFDQQKKADAAGDVFSLGVTVFELCTKTLPWKGAGGQALLKGGQAPALPENYSPELNELLQACMALNSGKRPAAKDLQLKGKHFLETGNWDLQTKKEKGHSRIKKGIPYLLATLFLALFMISIFWGYQNEQFTMPEEREQQTNPFAEQEIDQMLISTLEDELEVMKRRTMELEEENKQLKGGNDGRSIMENRKTPLVEEEQESPANRNQQIVKEEEQDLTPVQSTRRPDKEATSESKGSSTVSTPAKENTLALSRALEKQLNKISDPNLSEQARAAWKQETMARFAEGAIKIIDETEGSPKRYSAGIFLNLLHKVPHTIVVKNIKTDENKKVTELRLTMESGM